MNRLLSAVLDHPDHLGVGIGEATAIIVRGKSFTVMGDNSVIVIDSRTAKRVRSGKGKLQSAAGVKLHVMKDGQKFWFREK
jgi:cyanophycinase